MSAGRHSSPIDPIAVEKAREERQVGISETGLSRLFLPGLFWRLDYTFGSEKALSRSVRSDLSRSFVLEEGSP